MSVGEDKRAKKPYRHALPMLGIRCGMSMLKDGPTVGEPHAPSQHRAHIIIEEELVTHRYANWYLLQAMHRFPLDYNAKIPTHHVFSVSTSKCALHLRVAAQRSAGDRTHPRTNDDIQSAPIQSQARAA